MWRNLVIFPNFRGGGKTNWPVRDCFSEAAKAAQDKACIQIQATAWMDAFCCGLVKRNFELHVLTVRQTTFHLSVGRADHAMHRIVSPHPAVYRESEDCP